MSDASKPAMLLPSATRVNATRIKAASQPDLVTIPNVPIVSTGTYALSTGVHTFTSEDLSDAVRATEDPSVPSARLKIGHSSDFGDGEPAFGKVVNLALSSDGQTIYGDYVGVPRWLANIMPVAYPSRSIEGPIEATTTTGNTYGLIIEAVSLLGVVMPGVDTLADLPDLYGSDEPEGLVIKAGNRVMAKEVGGSMGKQITASVQTEDVRRAYYDSLDANQMWWWIRAIMVEPYELIVDDDEGNLYRVTYDPSSDELSFGDPVEVEIVYVDKAKVAAAAKGDGASSGRQVAVYASRDESRPEVKANQQEDKVELTKDQLAALGLPETATQEQVDAKFAELVPDAGPAAEETPAENPNTPEVPAAEETPAAEVTPAEPVAASSGTRQVDDELWKQTLADAKAGREARTEQVNAHRKGVVEAAVKAGKIPPARKEHYLKLMASDQEGTETLLTAPEDKGGLAAGAVPVTELGNPGNDEIEASGEAYPQHWFPEVAARKETGGAGRVVKTDPVKAGV